MICPKCEATKRIDTNDKDYEFKPFKATCKCGASIRGQFEFRQYYRKKVRLSGFYQKLESGIRGDIVVENISLMGIGFSCLRKHNFKKEDQLDITFTLDNPQKSKVSFRVEVLTIKNKFIGARRCDSQLLQPALGFYLR